jgi:6-pyruvoyltetrahydropterin/6-carboxytetrahydropterin synthase
MHKLFREVRFCVNPFLGGESVGSNSYACKPCGEGLGLFFELCVELTGAVDGGTGFVVNVTDIDKCVRQFVVPVFVERIRGDFGAGRHVSLGGVTELLRSAWGRLSGRFEGVVVSKLSLKLNPYRKIAIESEDSVMAYFSEKFEFAAMHKLWNDEYSEQKNLEVFGKCANPTGHGHNYAIEVTVEVEPVGDGLRIGDFERIVDDEFIRLVDHKNLNADVAVFSTENPTIENIAAFAWGKLAGRFDQGKLHCVTVWETERTCCSYFGP